ncbi:MAG: low molecular weight protein arginine phosphatase [Saccharofermentanales bacterium]|jgi:protein-tyrosine-phosphatase|nr:low molecular weight protein arginine phosphatase [Clostridiaceae bacterium]
MTTSRRILFVCTGNTCRSPMAAALFNAMKTDNQWQAESAGLAAFDGEGPSDTAVAVMHDVYAVDISHHCSRLIDCRMMNQVDWVLTMSPAQRDYLRRLCPDFEDRIMTLGDLAEEPETAVADPYGRDYEAYRSTAGQLAALIEKIIAKMV